MARPTTSAGRRPENFQAPDIASERRSFYSRLFRRFIWLTLLCSVVPLLLVGWGINLHYTNFARERLLNSLQTQVDYHRKLIERFENL